MTAKTNTQSKVELSKKRQSPMPEQTESNQQQLTSFELGAIIQRMQDVPGKLAPGSAQKLQHTIGNQVMGRLFTRTPSRHSVHTPSIATSLQRMLAARGIQAKLTVNAPDDQYEQEADAAAKHVVSTINAPKAPPQTTQRQEEDDDIQMKPLPVISSLQRQEDEELQLKPIIQRQEEDEQIMTKPMLQRVDYGAGGSIDDTVERDIQQARGGGQTLADNIRGPMEQAFGADFSGVRIHTGSHSDQLNHAVQAKAFTTGQDVFFRQGEYEPGSRGGQELLAHELTHVVQQNAGAVMRTLSPHQQYPQHPVTKIPLVNTENHMIQGIHEAATNSQASDGVSSVLNNTANSATDALYAIQRTIGQMSPNANKGLIQATTAAGPVKSRVATGQSIIQRIETINILGHSKEATDDVPLPIGRHLKEEAEGQHILRRLAQGDETALRELGVKFPSDYELQSHEWGLGYDKDEEMYVIVRGGPGMVNWPLLENVDGIAHTHPQPKDHPKLIDYSQDSMPELKVIDAFEQTSLVGIDGVFTGTYNSVLPSNSDLNASYTTYTTKPEMLYTPFRINDGGFFSTEPKDPLVSVEYGPVVATLRAGELGKNDEANMIMHFYGPIKVFRGTEEFWSGVIKCDTGRMAWLQKEKIPEDAKFRRENQLLLERRKGPELFEVEEKIKQREPSLVPSTPLLEKETVSAPMDIHSQLFPKEYYKAVKENARKKGAKFSGGLSVSKYGKLVKECNGYMEKGMWKKAAIEIDKIVTGLKDLDGKGLEYWESPAKKIEFFDPLYKKAIAVQQYIYSKT